MVPSPKTPRVAPGRPCRPQVGTTFHVAMKRVEGGSTWATARPPPAPSSPVPTSAGTPCPRAPRCPTATERPPVAPGEPSPASGGSTLATAVARPYPFGPAFAIRMHDATAAFAAMGVAPSRPVANGRQASCSSSRGVDQIGPGAPLGPWTHANTAAVAEAAAQVDVAPHEGVDQESKAPWTGAKKAPGARTVSSVLHHLCSNHLSPRTKTNCKSRCISDLCGYGRNYSS